MWLNYLTIAIRVISRNKLFTVINVFGLSIGLASSIIIFLYVDYEYSYDKHIIDSDYVYNICSKGRDGKLYARSSAPLAPLLKLNYPEIESFTRISESNFDKKLVINVDENAYTETNCLLVDSSFFNIFDCQLLEGNFSKFSTEKNVIIITEKIALKYFNSIDVVGKNITVNERFTFIIIGIVEDCPPNSHLIYEMLIPISWAEEFFAFVDLKEWRSNHNFCSYVKLNKNVNVDEFQARILADTANSHDGYSQYIKSMYFQPIRKIHLKNIQGSIKPGVDKSYLYIFIGIALVILIIACINFMNLLTAIYLNRVREIGMRKVIGANRTLIIIQFLCESVFLSLGTLFFAIIIIESVLPIINQYLQVNIYLDYLNFELIIFILGIVLFVGFISGTYPAFFISGVEPALILKSGFKAKRSNLIIKNVLVVFQFVITIILIIVSTFFYLQMRYIQSVDVGYNRKNLIIIPTYTKSLAASVPELKRILKQNPNILALCANSFLPSDNRFFQSFYYEGERGEDIYSLIAPIFVDEDFFETYQIKLTSGENFNGEDDGLMVGYILNELAVKELGWEQNPLGKKLSLDGPKNYGHVIGVVENINFKSLHSEVTPCLFRIAYPSYPYPYLSIRFRKNNFQTTIESIREKWIEINPKYPFEYFFAEDDFMSVYKADMKTGQLIALFSIISVVISCLGLFGLIAYSAKQRIREISIRKVFGASISQIVFMLSTDYTKWVILANIIAWPISFYILDRWLQNFHYRTQLHWWVFLGAGFITLIIALLTVSAQAIKAANTNPSETLKFE